MEIGDKVQLSRDNPDGGARYGKKGQWAIIIRHPHLMRFDIKLVNPDEGQSASDRIGCVQDILFPERKEMTYIGLVSHPDSPEEVSALHFKRKDRAEIDLAAYRAAGWNMLAMKEIALSYSMAFAKEVEVREEVEPEEEYENYEDDFEPEDGFEVGLVDENPFR